MKISLISGSHRQGSQSQRISEIICLTLKELQPNLDSFSLDLGIEKLPLWSPEKKNGVGREKKKERIKNAQRGSGGDGGGGDGE